MKITLIQPRKPSFGTEADKHWQLTRPFALFYLASYLAKNTKHEVQIIDLEKEEHKDSTLKDIFAGNVSEIFGITATTFSRFEAIKIARYIKRIRPSSFVIVGGVHFMYCAKETLERIPDIDIVVRGEGEKILADLANTIGSGRSYEKIRGITYRRDDGEIVQNPDQDVFEDLDSIPLYTKYEYNEYPEYLFGFPGRVPAISVMSSRGCPFNCIFCSKAGMKYRLRDAEKVVDEIEGLKERFPIEAINFVDLTFTASRSHVTSLCNELINRDVNLKWWCESRVSIPLDSLDLMKKAGCISLVIGVESGSPRILKRIRKQISIDQVIDFCRKCSEIGIHAQAYFMFSHPDETEADVEKTLTLIRRLSQYGITCAFQPSIIVPGTELEVIAHSKGILDSDFSWCDPYEDDLNLELEQLANIPLFIDKLSPDDLRYFFNEKRFQDGVNKAVNLGFRDLAIKAYRTIKEGKPSLRSHLLEPRAYLNYLVGKMKR